MAKFYTATIENLMYGYDLVGQLKEAMEMAELNRSLLTETANDRRPEGDLREVTDLLDPEQKEMYARALDFLRKSGPR